MRIVVACGAESKQKKAKAIAGELANQKSVAVKNVGITFVTTEIGKNTLAITIQLGKTNRKLTISASKNKEKNMNGIKQIGTA